jgi:hypothetical protein
MNTNQEAELKKQLAENSTLRQQFAQNFTYPKTRRLLREGKLIRQPCEICGNLNTVAHHDNYTRPDEIRWFCQKDHMAHHRSLGWGTSGRHDQNGRQNPRHSDTDKVRVSINLPPRLDDAVYEAAGKLGITKSEYAERALRAALAQDGKSV